MFQFYKKKNKKCQSLLKPYKKKNRYKFLNILGKGGIAQVSCYFDSCLNRIVALKELKDKHIVNPHLLQAFITESKLIAYLNHPGVVPLYDTFKVKDDALCYTMKLIEGERLTSLLSYNKYQKQSEGYSINKFLEIFLKLCETLMYVHDKGVLHLDLKPDNIMVGEYGEVMIMDWGNAKLYNKKPYYSYLKRHMTNVKQAGFEKEAENLILGTPYYMSPEQTNSSRGTLTPASDIFSAGIIFYQMITGKHPFPDKDNTGEVMIDIRRYDPPPVYEVNSDVPLRLSQICEKMLRKDCKTRYMNFKEVLSDLNEFYHSGEAFSVEKYNAGDTIIKEGETGDYSFKILTGIIEVIKEVDGKQQVLTQLGEGEIVGELAIFSKQPRTATIRAVEMTTIRVMDRDSVEKELEKLSPWVGNMITALSERFVGLNEKVAKYESESGRY